MINFREVNVKTGTGKCYSYWYANPYDLESIKYLEKSIEKGRHEISANLNGRRVPLFPGVVSLAMKYNSERKLRALLGQECVAFGYSCQTGDSLDFMPVNQKNSRVVVMTEDNFHPMAKGSFSDVEVYPGEVGFSYMMNLGFGTTPYVGLHFAVAVDTINPGKPEFFMSKLGVPGPVILTDAKQIGQIYPASVTGLVTGLKLSS